MKLKLKNIVNPKKWKTKKRKLMLTVATVILVTKMMQTELLKVKNAEIGQLRKTVTALEERVDALEGKVDAADAYERRDTLIVSGSVPNAEQGENCKSIVREMLKEKTRLSIDLSDISIAHRLGRKPQQQGPDKRRRDLNSAGVISSLTS